jgi:peptide chain release factor 1
VSGKHAKATFKDEAGGHRWQRIPPTEKRGRIQTSTITVAVLAEPTAVEVVLHERDLDFKFCRASGNGGQNVAKTDSAVQLTHKPTGISVRCETERSQAANKETAVAVLRARIWEVTQLALDGKRAYERKQQIGCGARGDKVRTIRVRDDVVNDHVTGRQWKFKAYARGDWD